MSKRICALASATGSVPVVHRHEFPAEGGSDCSHGAVSVRNDRHEPTLCTSAGYPGGCHIGFN